MAAADIHFRQRNKRQRAAWRRRPPLIGQVGFAGAEFWALPPSKPGEIA